jgi:HSP20 family molecular chaperone IbpA
MLQPWSSMRTVPNPAGFEAGLTVSAWPLPRWEEESDAALLRVEVPGYAAEDLGFELIGETLSISGHRARGGSWRSFRHSVAVPPALAPATFAAELEGDVLVIRARRAPALAHAA